MLLATGCDDAAAAGEAATAGAELRYCMRKRGVVGGAVVLEGPSLDGRGFNLQSSVPSPSLSSRTCR